MTEAKNNRGMFTFTFRSLDVAFPVRYPRARCPTANVCCPSYCFVCFCVRSSVWSREIKCFVERARGLCWPVCFGLPAWQGIVP